MSGRGGPFAGIRSLDVEQAVSERYSRAARTLETGLCCPVEYDRKLLDVIPKEILERDYGCGDPSRHLQPGETVLDLGSGGGKVCYIAAQVVGPTGRVIGVDCNDEMLALARKHQQTVGQRLGFHNVEFRKGKIQDLALDLQLLDALLAENPVKTSGDWFRLEEQARVLRESRPLIPDDSVDVVISNCVLNLVRLEDRMTLFREMFRVLKRSGRAVISDIVSDEDVPVRLKNDPRLWSGCLSGAFREDRFVQAFTDVGFYGAEILARQSDPWAVVEGIEFRSLTVQAFKGKEGPCLDRKQAVIYKGPWKAVIDDDGHKLLRGERMAVCDKTFHIYSSAPYADEVIPVPPRELIPLENAPPFPCQGSAIRAPRETKGDRTSLTVMPEGDCCGPGNCC